MNTEMRRYDWWTDDAVYAFNLMLTSESDGYANCMLMLTAKTIKPWQRFVKTSCEIITLCRSSEMLFLYSYCGLFQIYCFGYFYCYFGLEETSATRVF